MRYRFIPRDEHTISAFINHFKLEDFANPIKTTPNTCGLYYNYVNGELNLFFIYKCNTYYMLTDQTIDFEGDIELDINWLVMHYDIDKNDKIIELENKSKKLVNYITNSDLNIFLKYQKYLPKELVTILHEIRENISVEWGTSRRSGLRLDYQLKEFKQSLLTKNTI